MAGCEDVVDPQTAQRMCSLWTHYSIVSKALGSASCLAFTWAVESPARPLLEEFGAHRLSIPMSRQYLWVAGFRVRRQDRDC